MKPLHESVQVKLYVPKHVDQTLKNLGYDVTKVYQRDFLDTIRALFDTIDEVPCARGAREMLEQEIKTIDRRS